MPNSVATGITRTLGEIIMPPEFGQSVALLNGDKTETALTRSFRHRIPQPPAPRGRQDRVEFFAVNLDPQSFRSAQAGRFCLWPRQIQPRYGYVRAARHAWHKAREDAQLLSVIGNFSSAM